MTSAIADLVRRYLDRTSDTYEMGHPNYFARLALSEALEAYLEGNYGIGAVAVFTDENEVREYRARNRMITGEGIIDHAEIRSLLRCRAGIQPDAKYGRNYNAFTAMLPLGLSIYGTLEPCPMCTIAITNAGAIQSISTVADGALIPWGGNIISDGAANVIGEKAKLQPFIWQDVQSRQGLHFSLLDSTDRELRLLSEQIFLDTREEIDNLLAERTTSISVAIKRTFPPER